MTDRRPMILWFRRDLRLSDQQAVASAASSGRPVIPLHILDETMGGAARWWLHHSLAGLHRDIAALGNRLVLRRGPATEVIAGLIAETGAEAIAFNRSPDPAVAASDEALARRLRQAGIEVITSDGGLLFEPGGIRTGTGQRFRVFTPFWRACRAAPPPAWPLPAPEALPAPSTPVAGDKLDDWCLLPTAPDWARGFAPCWQPGEAGARARLAAFIRHDLRDYGARRDRPDLQATSRLSPHLAFGEISPGQVWHAAHHALARDPARSTGVERFLSELGWREFSYHLLAAEPEMPRRPLRPEFARFPTLRDDTALRAWQRGLTGYPIVDAGMRELWQTGWMHNRVRMVAASFLIKDLLLPWTEGLAWFADTLVDHDVASNAASWQWVAGCGADAAPFFRIFNPTLQSRKFDPAGAYIRRFVPELARLPDELIHAPAADPDRAARHGVVLGRDYPAPIVDHDAARQRALAALASLKQENAA
ncbi:cryptochrome/photolyase family protein [Zavarzinia aquatilis]|uniref:Deoxyribodipyrimidine photo-lyase n=1 Tax=Zavarzinia aquatilis TaxID=2211142 RepID=A0A317DXI6_9PROT|nr:deoxyribodipyrimidine photo-lyase [Zavarzinia aquatilis]PWR18566.1 deoxyribodipyrimidine photolyase [Zavarzinia aquatilis]